MSEGSHSLARQLALVSQIARVTSASLGLDELMQEVYDVVAPFFEHETFAVMRCARATEALQLVYGVEAGERMDEAEAPLGGLSDLVLREQRSLYIPDLESASASLPTPAAIARGSRLGSWLGVVLRIRDQAIGVVAVAAKSKNAYSEEDERLLATVADQLAVAIDHTSLLEETRGQAERLELLNRASKAVSSTLDLNGLLVALYQEIASVFEHDAFLVVLYKQESDELELFFGMENGVRLAPERRPLGGFTGVVVSEGKTLHIRNFAVEKEHLPTPNMVEGTTSNHASWLGVPLIVGDRVLGALCIMTDRPNAYDPDKEKLFETLADQIAFAVSNAGLFHTVHDAAERLAIVNRIGRVVGREHGLDRLAETVYREIAPVFEADTFYVALVNEEEDSIGFPFMIDEGERVAADSVPLGEGLTSTVIRTKETLHIHCSEEYAQATGRPALFGSMKAPETWLGIPLFTEGRVIGVINVQSYQPRAYSEDQALLLETIADQIAGSFERARLYEAVQRELDERARTEAQLAAERTLLRTIIDNLPDFIYSKDLYGRYVVANSAIARFFGCETPSKILGKALGDLLPEDEGRRYIEEEKDILLSGTPVLNQEACVVDRSTGEPRWLLITKLPFADARGKAIGLVGIDRDITARKHAEQEVERYLAELEVANEEVRQFAYIVSHDLRAPLVNLRGFSAELRDAMQTLAPHLERSIETMEGGDRARLAALVAEDIPEALGFIETSVSRMDSFINSVLKLSRLGRRELALEPVDVTELVEITRQGLAHQMARRGVELIVGDLPQVVADPTAMEQIIGNLLTNAVNYLDPERPGRIEIGGERTGSESRFWVVDNGRGIAKEDEEKVFAPFRRAGRQDVAGEGMGLSCVRTMVRQHGGRIWFESEPGVGSTFSFTIAHQEAKGTPHGRPE